MQNHFVVSGAVVKPPQLTHSPAGISHLKFVLEHRSEQIEAGLPRRAYVRMVTVVSGALATQWANELNVGSDIQVSGFLNRIEDKNGIGKLVLHAQQLVKI
ncbi:MULTISPECIES: primosomal replication protein N [Idiomarinaceae]|uniref:Replication restart protein PriB n=4 Tax=Pseudidiomarina TaxID=2800384 RepID=A0A368US75_9GAMM|nr:MULTISPECIES: primosomal replication protein N [Idiomarinaceae]NCU57995.1 primosomal replication protein N [Idiomarina sp. FenA--70]NCU60693.1 primosomal replication protein N [Idiomarina sp. FenBw--71]MDT7524496.1 primosomal replication protein N [Pseudidiomarina sp. GXY010]MDX1526508.1 primosomal replication protein N [Pseudidiomarina maritima]MRJ42381.1 primosomal replication protein N [Idiomarina sp. FeN1]